MLYDVDITDLLEKIEGAKSRIDDVVDGNGLIVLHNTRIDVDASIRITDLLKKNKDLESRIAYLESLIGSEGSTTPTVPITELRLGNWIFTTSADGNILYKKVDVNKGLTVTPAWCTKEENTLNVDDVEDA
ncbi:MAG: hypothetical protein PHN44_00110 [Candidatus Marinimicrobia bacterium]|nr:hypothetical protein [Candidatus Neomarinimicrobiota bacterium]